MAPLIPLVTLAQQLKAGDRLLGLDLGTRTIGLALASVPDGIPTPLSTIRRTRFTSDATHLMRIVSEERIAALVVGLPLNMDGSAGARVQSTKAFCRNLMRFNLPPIALCDERLSTSEAHDLLAEAGVAGRNRADIIDSAAAAVILGDALAVMGKASA